jgi:hypothetical protein
MRRFLFTMPQSRGEYYCVVRHRDGSASWHGPFHTAQRAAEELVALNYDLIDVGLGKADLVAWRVVRKGEEKITPWQPMP